MGTTWNYMSTSPLEIIILTFTTETQAEMHSYQDGDFTCEYKYKEPHVTLLYGGNELTGTHYNDNIIFEGAGHEGKDMVFKKKLD